MGVGYLTAWFLSDAAWQLLRRADDAFLLDTSHMTIDEQVEFVLNKVTSRIFNGDYALQE